MLSITISYNSHIVLKVMSSKLNPAKEETDCQVKLINVYRIKKQQLATQSRNALQTGHMSGP